MQPARLLLILSLLAKLVLGWAISVGPTSVRLDSILAALSGGDPVIREVILDLRLPRALNAFSTGGLLALAGVLMQVLLRNPLADPYVLGISGGAAVGASGCTAIVSLMLALGDESRLRGMLFWLMGDLSFSAFSPAALAILLILGFF